MQLEKFLFFYDLELGGVIIGFYHLIIYSLLAVVAIVSFFVAPIYYPDTNLIFLGVAIVIYILISCVLIYIASQLIIGIEFRDHRRVQRFRILGMIGIILNILIVLTALSQIGRFKLNAVHIALLIIYLIISFSVQIYIFLVVDSLYKRFRDEEFPQPSQR